MTRLEMNIERLKDTERELRDRIGMISQLLQQDGDDYQGYMYVTQEDLKAIPGYEVSWLRAR
jgi:hypothetical protein